MMVYTQRYLTTAEWGVFRNIVPSASTSPTENQVLGFIELAEKRFDTEVGSYDLQSGLEVVTKGLAHGLSLSYPVNTINSVYVSNGDVITPTWTLVPSTDYVLKSNGRILLRNPIIHREYKVDFDSGYAIDSVPQEVKYLVYLMSMSLAFNAHLFESNVSDNVTRIVDVEVYREITNGGDPFKGFGSLNKMIDDAKANVKGQLRTRLG